MSPSVVLGRGSDCKFFMNLFMFLNDETHWNVERQSSVPGIRQCSE